MFKLEHLLEWGGIKKEIIFLVISGLALLISIFDFFPLPVNAAWIAIVLCGIPIILEAVAGLVREFDIKADVLVSIALVASVIIGEAFAAGEVAFIMQLGALLEDVTVSRARAGIEKLVRLTPRTARVLNGDREEIVPAREVAAGSILKVLPGETVAVDGVILSGQTSVDQSVMTGESMPVDKSAGDEVQSGTVNHFGAFTMKALKVGEDSSLQRMIRLVESADAGKAKIVGVADRWATWIVVIALTAAIVTGFVTGEVIRAVTILVVFCPCALVLATPTAIMAAIGNAAKFGVLVREGDALERLSGVEYIMFDKTGTLTTGVPEVMACVSRKADMTEEELFALVAAAENLSEHPLGKAVVRSYKKKGAALKPAADFRMIPGRGIQALADGKRIVAGNAAFMQEHLASGGGSQVTDSEAAAQFLEKGYTVIYVGLDEDFAGLVALSDKQRDDAAEAVGQIGMLGVRPVLLTGDRPEAAGEIAACVGITEYRANCLPEDKLAEIERLVQAGHTVCMVGDGINDAPALKRATVGIAMGGIGSDIAVEAADIALVRDDISALPYLLALSKKMLRTINMNMAFSMGLNFAAVILAMTGILSPIVGALVHNAGSVAVIINSALLLQYKK